MKVLVYNIKGAGHVNPTLAIVKALVAQGHEVVYNVSREWKERVEQLGAVYANTAAGDEPFTTANYHPDALFPLQLLPATSAVSPRLVEAAQRVAPDLIFYDTFALWGAVVAHSLGCPSVGSHSTLTISPEQHARITMLPDGKLDERNGRAIDEIAARWGVQFSARDVGTHRARHNLLYSSRMLNGDVGDEPGEMHFVGPMFGRDAEPADLSALGLPTGPRSPGVRRVYVSLGTVVAQMHGFTPSDYTPFLDAVRGDPSLEVVISVGQSLDPEAFSDVPENVILRRSVPQPALLRDVDAFVTHAGANSIHEALFHDVPLVCVPYFGDQPVNARRVEQLGAGAVLPPHALTATALRTTLLRVLEEPTYRDGALRIGQSLQATGGVAEAVDVLTRVAQG